MTAFTDAVTRVQANDQRLDDLLNASKSKYTTSDGQVRENIEAMKSRLNTELRAIAAGATGTYQTYDDVDATGPYARLVDALETLADGVYVVLADGRYLDTDGNPRRTINSVTSHVAALIGFLDIGTTGDTVTPDLAYTPIPSLDGAGAAAVMAAIKALADQQSHQRSISFSRITQDGAYRAWAQGKTFTYDGTIYQLFNGGSSHSNTDLCVYMTTSPDGTFWTDPVVILGPAAVTGGVTCWGAGADSDGNFWMIARYQGSDYLSTHTFHRLFKSTDLGATWTAVLAPIGFVDTDSSEVPVEYHDFCELPTGHLCWGYHFSNGRVGLIEFDPDTYAYTTRDIYTSDDVGGAALYVEPTVQISGSTLFGFLRTQDPTTGNAKMWTSTWSTGFGAFAIVDTDINIKYTPVPACIVDDTVYITYARRYDDANGYGALYLRRAALSDVLAGSFAFSDAQLIAQLPASASGSSGTGVPAMALHDSKLIIGCSFNVRQQENLADMGAVVVDLDRSRVNAGSAISREQISSSTPALTKLISLLDLTLTGTLRVDKDADGVARIRLDGNPLAYINGTTLEIGSTNTNSGVVDYRWYAGTSVAAFLALASGSRAMQGLVATQRVELTTDGGILFRTTANGQHLKALPTGQNQFAAALANTAITHSTITTGFALTIGDNIEELSLDGAGTISSGTITMPAAPVDGQRVKIVSTVAVTALTVSPNSGQSIKAAATTLASGPGGLAYRYYASNATWYPA